MADKDLVDNFPIDQDADAWGRLWSMVISEGSPIYREILSKGRIEGLKESYERGFKQGLKQGFSQSIGRILTRRFGEIPSAIPARLSELTVSDLEALLDEALVAADLPAFERQLSRLENRNEFS